jgi:hypothetical protein
VNPDNLGTTVLVGHTNLKLAVEAAWTPQSWINGVTTIGGSDNDDVIAALHPVEQGQQLGHDPALDLACHILTLGRDTV